MTTELRRASPGGAGGQGQFQLLYQPVVALRAGGGSRPRRQLEALLRWEHPTRGLLAPADFLPTAEESGLIVEIGASVLHSACALAGAWQDDGVHSSVAVNVSAAELRSPGFVDRVAAAMELAEIEPSWLRLEITENSLLEPADAIVATVAGLRSLGVGISLDDFGTGFSSLTHLERFPVDALKIDRSFVGRLGDGVGAGIVAGVLALARALGLEVVAEGVETPGQLARLRALGCDYAQGFLLGRPAESSAILGGGYPDLVP